MSRYNGEQVLVIPRSLFDHIGAFQGLSLESDRYFDRLLDPKNNLFLDRDAAEADPTHKQIIPYSIFRHKGRILHYTRGKSGGESRLHAQGSIGIGGHINPIDTQDADSYGHATYMAGVERELDEELNITGSFSQKVIAVLNDDSNEVGEVHLGIVHLFELESDDVTSNEDSLANLAWQTPDRLKGELFESLETWSQLCIAAIDEWDTPA